MIALLFCNLHVFILYLSQNNLKSYSIFVAKQLKIILL